MLTGSKPDKDKDGNPGPYAATAIESPGGHFVFVGTNNGKVFQLDAPGFVATELSDPVISQEVRRFAALRPNQAFLVAGQGVFRREKSGWVQLHGKVKAKLPVGLEFVGLVADPTTTPPTLYVAAQGALDPDPTKSGGIFRSEDSGETWFPFSDGLPRACAAGPVGQFDLRWVQESSGVTFLYAATFGWSIFRRPLNFEEVLKPVTVEGHMHLLDINVVGTDEIVDLPFSATRLLGPLHPFDEMTFIGEDTGGEMRVVLKLNFAWKTDFSVVLTVSADLIERDDEDELDAHVDATETIVPATVESVAIKLESDDLIAPNRVHIEFTVSN